jgi:hypothetical protein
MIEGLRQGPDEDDEAFLSRAERVMQMEETQIREGARALLAAAVRTYDKPETVAAGPDSIRGMLNGPSYTTRRACLLARSLCREMQDASTGSEPVALSAYQLLTQLALETLRADRDDRS